MTPKIKQKFITDDIELILNNNYFQFNNVNYIQTLETAIETKMAPTYDASLTLGYLHENLYEICILQQHKKRIYLVME